MSGAGHSIVPIVRSRQPAAVIVLGANASELEQLAAKELARFVEKLASARLDIVTPDGIAATGKKTLLLVGTPGSNPLVDQALAGTHDLRKLKPGGFVLHTGRLLDRTCIVISGKDEIGTLYCAYALLEALGATFLLTGDLLPPPADDLELPAVSRSFETPFPRRGFLISLINLHSGIWSLPDYMRLVDQMVKLRLNLLSFYAWQGQPWVEYSYRGEKNLLGDMMVPDSGFLRFRLFCPSADTRQVRVGAEHFRDRRYMAPMELQGVSSPEEAHRAFSALIKEVFRYARSRRISTGLAVEPNYIAPNLGRFARKYGSRPYHPVFGFQVSPTDPVGIEIAGRNLDAILATYPDIDQLFLFSCENYDRCKHPESLALYEKMRPRFARARRKLEEEWGSAIEKFRRTPDDMIDADIGFFEVARKVAERAKRIRPEKRIGLGFFFRGYLLQDVDKLMDRDFAFSEWQSCGVFPLKNDVNAMYFANMGGRETQIVPDVDDDGSMFGMPFQIRKYHKDGLFGPARDAGVSGFAASMFRARGTEHNSRFLAQGAWEPDLTPHAFYDRYSREIFGPAAAPHVKAAFDILEDDDERLGWRGNMNFTWGSGFLDLGSLHGTLQPNNPYDGPADPSAMLAKAQAGAPKFEMSALMLEKALAEMENAGPTVSAKGKPMLDYLVSKTRAYRAYMKMAALVERGFEAYARAFMDYGNDEPLLAQALEAAQRLFLAAQAKARETTERAAEIVDHPGDLAILFELNRLCLDKIDDVCDDVRRVVNYHRGLPYWKGADRPIEEQGGFAI
ncbi:MAG: alpha-glucuronidase family glycosyl hydrolase [Planctomycetota bacterium]